MQIYLVGGAVRDELLGRPVQERDWVVVGATVEELLRLGYQPVGKDFPVFLHPETREEYALARTERKTAPGYHGFRFHAAPDVTLEQDLARRDLTINAMARAADGTLIDPYGGRRDLEARLLRHVSPAFAEDPVRILRLARFAARYAGLGFRVAPETLELMRAMVAAGEVDALVPERVWAETARALLEPAPQRFFTVLAECGALARLFPELARLPGQPWEEGADAWAAAEAALARAAARGEDGPVRFAVLLHSAGAGLGADPGAAATAPIQALCRRLRVPNDYRELALAVARHQAAARRAATLDAAALLALLEALDAFRRTQRFAAFLRAVAVLAASDAASARLEQARRKALAVDARAWLARGLRGTELGAALHQARLQAIAGEDD
ncbi:MAG TPA: multifunctional CCA addition/repair protein [Nevskiales bacterium]|nr:multifunctional CCA addition/repair protein [Nevskiales bacterium]